MTYSIPLKALNSHQAAQPEITVIRILCWHGWESIPIIKTKTGGKFKSRIQLYHSLTLFLGIILIIFGLRLP